MQPPRASQRDSYIHVSVTGIPSSALTMRNEFRASLPAYDSIPGQKGRYRLVNEELGQGGMGLVCLGERESDGRSVAIKFSLVGDNSFIAREYFALEAVDHPNIVKVLDGGVVDGRYFLVMELLQGSNLDELIFARNTIEPDIAIAIALQALDGLDAVHRARFLHCDLKPTNLFLADSADSMDVKLIDFGLSRRIEEGPAPPRFGTPGFNAPEQVMGEPIDQRADIYSVGAVLFNMLTGNRLFSGPIENIIEQTISSNPARPSSIVPGIPPIVDAIVMRALEKNPEKRFKCVPQFRENLEFVLEAIAPD